MVCMMMRFLWPAAIVVVFANVFELDVGANSVEEGISLLQTRAVIAPGVLDSVSSSGPVPWKIEVPDVDFQERLVAPGPGVVLDSVSPSGLVPSKIEFPDVDFQERLVAPGQRVVVTVSTLGNVDFVQNWGRSLESAGVEHYYVYAIGPGAYEGLSQVLPGRVCKVPDEHVLFSSTLSQNEASASEHWGYKSEDYSQLMLSVPGIVKWLLEEKHENFLYTDTDVVAFSDPYAAFPDGYRRTMDLLGSVDTNPADDEAWDSCSADNFCGGIWWVQRTPASLAFVSRWAELAAQASQGSKNQPLYNQALEFAKEEQHGGLRVGILSCERFPNGARYFHNLAWRSAARRPEAMVHANALIGAEKKRLALNASCLWRPEGVAEGPSTVRPLGLPQSTERVLLFRNVPATSSSHNLALRLSLHRVALQFAFDNGLALVPLPTTGDGSDEASVRAAAEETMLGLEPTLPAGSNGGELSLAWEEDAAPPIQGEGLLANECVNTITHARALAGVAVEGPVAICLDVSSWNRKKSYPKLYREQGVQKALRTDLWYRRRARIARPGSSAFQPLGPLRVALCGAHLPDGDTLKVLLQVLRVFSEAGYARSIEVEMVSETRGGATGSRLLEKLEAPAGLSVTARHWSPHNPDDASKAMLERIGSAAVLVLPDATAAGSLWLWAAKLSHGVVLAKNDLVRQSVLAERDAAGLVVPWARHLRGSGNANAHFDPKDFARAWQGSCLTGWDGGVAEDTWNAAKGS